MRFFLGGSIAFFFGEGVHYIFLGGPLYFLGGPLYFFGGPLSFSGGSVKRLWTVIPELHQDGYGGTIGTNWSGLCNRPAVRYKLQTIGSLSLETAAGTTTSTTSMVDMRVLGKPSIFAGDEASWKGWSFVMLSFSAAVSPELRALMEKARINVDGMLNVHLTSAEQVWSRQLYYMLSLSTSGEAQRRLQNVPEGEGAEAWKVFSEHYEPKTATRYVGMLRQILLYDFRGAHTTHRPD